MVRPSAELGMALLMAVLVTRAGAVRGAVKDVGMKCPARCWCNLTVTPNVRCSGLFSLPGNFPAEAESFECEDCPITNMKGNIFQNYTNLKKLRLSGDASPVFDEQSLEDVRAIQEVVFERFNISAADRASLAGPNHTVVLVNIPRGTPPTSPAVPEVAPRRSGELPSQATTTIVGAGQSPETTPRTSDSRLVSGGGGPSTPRQPRCNHILVIKEVPSYVFWLLGTLFVVAATAALYSALVLMGRRSKHLEQGYQQARL